MLRLLTERGGVAMSAMERVTVIGAGTMGHGIAQVAAAAGLGVSLHDVSEELIRKGLDAVQANLDKGVEKGKVTAEAREATLSWLDAAPDLEAVASTFSGVGPAANQADDFVVKHNVHCRKLGFQLE